MAPTEDIPEKGSVSEKCDKKVKVYTYYPFIRVKPTNCVLPSLYKDFIEPVRNFKVRDGDTFLISNPKCGTTWTMEMVWLIANDLAFEKAEESLFDRFPQIDNVGCLDRSVLQTLNTKMDAIEYLNDKPSPRFIKSHLPKELLPTEVWEKKTKVIFVVRNPKDAAVSNFHHYRLFHCYTGTMEEFLEATLREEVLFSPFWEKVIPFWNIRNNPNVVFIKFEDMKTNFDGVIETVCKFYGKTYTAEQIQSLKDHLSISKMKNNKAVNYDDIKGYMEDAQGKKLEGSFVREGQTGGWRNAMTPEMSARFDEWTMAKIRGTGLEEFYGS